MDTQDNYKFTTSIAVRNVQNHIRNYVLDLLVRQISYKARPLIFLCIGSDRYTGDALGPLVGSYLEEHISCTVFGSLDYPVHAGNLIDTIHFIYKYYDSPLIIALDACLGQEHEIGNIEIWEGSLEAGIAVGNPLPSVGHISIIGVVNVCSERGYCDLQNTPLSIVVKLSKVIGSALTDVVASVAYS